MPRLGGTDGRDTQSVSARRDGRRPADDPDRGGDAVPGGREDDQPLGGGGTDPVHPDAGRTPAVLEGMGRALCPLERHFREAADRGWHVDIQLACGIRLPDVLVLEVDSGVATLGERGDSAVEYVDLSPGVVAFLRVKD